MTLSTPWLALVAAAALALLGGGLRELASRTGTDDGSDGDDRRGVTDPRHRSREVSA